MAGLMSRQDLDLFTDDEGTLGEIGTEEASTIMPTHFPTIPTKTEVEPLGGKAGALSDDEGPGIRSVYAPTLTDRKLEPTEMGTEINTQPVMKPSSKAEGDGPLLWCGRGFHKSLSALPDKWITFGRRKGSTVLMDKSFVSYSHCKVRWYSKERRLVLIDTSKCGTFVNGEKVLGNEKRPRELKHSDKIVVQDEGSETHFDFLVDFRPTGHAMTDPRDMEEVGHRNRPASVELERLKGKLLQLQKQLAKQEDDAADEEKRFYDIEVQKFEVTKKAEMRTEETKRINEATKHLQDDLLARRERWKVKLAELYESNKVKLRPLVELTADKQDQVARMEMQSTELERQIYPEKFALAELPDQDKAKEGLGDATEDETEQDGDRKPPPTEEGSADASGPYKSAGYAPSTPAKTAGFEDSAPMESAQMQDSAAFHEEAVPFITNLSMKDLFGEDEDEADATAAPSEPDAKRQKKEE